MKPEYVRWIDSGMHMPGDGWKETHLFVKDAQEWKGEVETVGGLLHEDDSVIVLGLSYDKDNDSWYGAQLIAKSSIIERHTLQVVQEVD